MIKMYQTLHYQKMQMVLFTCWQEYQSCRWFLRLYQLLLRYVFPSWLLLSQLSSHHCTKKKKKEETNQWKKKKLTMKPNRERERGSDALTTSSSSIPKRKHRSSNSSRATQLKKNITESNKQEVRKKKHKLWGLKKEEFLSVYCRTLQEQRTNGLFRH